VKIKKSKIEQIVREELALHLKELLEAPKTVGADKDNDGGEDEAPGKDMAPKKGAGKGPERPDGDQEAPKAKPAPKSDKVPADAAPDEEEPEGEPEEVPTGDDPADDEIAADASGEDEEQTGGAISDELVGKTVQSISYEPDSKMMPGAREITIQFEQQPHPLKILIGKSGMIRYVYKGGVHQEL
jgi:hypothetical protein